MPEVRAGIGASIGSHRMSYMQRRTGRRLPRALLVFVFAGATAGTAAALDLPTLDKVSVMMSLDQVRYIAGPPDEMAQMAPDLRLATWKMTGAPGMIAAGGIFDGRSALIAQAYVFAGETGAQALASLREFGFKVVEGPDGVTRLYGPDDDTGRPLVVLIDERPETTTVFAYEQREYEKRLAAGPLPTGPGTPVAVPSSGPSPTAAGMDPAVRNALAAGIGLMGGMKPIQKSTTLSSSSSTTRNPDGSVTTRSRSTSASVSVDPAGVANALLQLMK
ncbi:MAG: hypothetical protein U1F58_13145 [Burkholderiales bacterium]